MMTLNRTKTKIMLGQKEGNHLSLPLLRGELGEKHEPDCILVTESTVVVPKNMSEEELPRLHRNLAHASPGSLFRVLKAAHYNNTEAQIKTVVESCGRIQQNAHTQPPLIKEHLPEFAGHAVRSDIFYVVGEEAQKNPLCPVRMRAVQIRGSQSIEIDYAEVINQLFSHKLGVILWQVPRFSI